MNYEMAGRNDPARLAEYVELKRFALALSEYFDEWLRAQPPLRVAVFGENGELSWREAERPKFSWAQSLARVLEVAEAGGYSRALPGLRMAVNDLLDSSRDFSRESVVAADQFLSGKGCATLSAMRERVWKTVPKILRRGRIRDDEEYYLTMERLNDTSDSGFAQADRVAANQLVAAYEAKRRA